MSLNYRLRERERRQLAKRHDVLVRIVAPHFVAGLVFDADTERCVETAPILAASLGKTMLQVAAYAHRRGWEIEKVKPGDR